MDRRQLLWGMTALGLARNLTLPEFLSAQNVATDSLQPTGGVNISDRERDGLRGPVKTSVAEGETSFGKNGFTQEYDADGRLLASRSAYPGGESENTWSYDAEGRLLRSTNKSGDSSSVQIYAYDERGRLRSIADNNGSQTDFHYDSQGGKIETQTIPPRPGDVHTGIGLGAMAGGMERGYGLYDGGTVRKRYDGHDLPVESQILDSEGNLVTRIIRSYDSKGRLTAERTIPENWEIGFAKQMLAKAPEEYRTEEDLKQITEHLKPMMKAFVGNNETSYTYDTLGRMIGTHIQSSFVSQDTAIAYNDQGDIVERRETSALSSPQDFHVSFHQDEAGNLVPDKPQSEWPAQPDLSPQSSLIRYTYEYDSQSNWTEQITIFPDGRTSTIRRTLTYY